MQLIPTILCGGVGSRLWPVSRESHPKPFIRLSDGQSLLQKAFLRASSLENVKEILTVTNRELLFKSEDEYREVNQKQISTSFILEPFGRNTAAAIAVAALQVASQYGSETLMLVLAADHLISDQNAFNVAVNEATALALQEKIVVFGIQPTAPETAYGYIESNGVRVVRFVEKPSKGKAQEYLDSGNFQWNSGMFCFMAGTILQEMQNHCPDILSAAKLSKEKSRLSKAVGFSQLDLDRDSFALVPDKSVDYAVMEKSTNMAIVSCDIGWSDIGSWDALGELTSSDRNGNRLEAKTILHEVSNCFVQGKERMIGMVGVDNLIVIDTPDALLIADKSHAQDVKHLYTALKDIGHESHKTHMKVHRPWGAYSVLEESTKFKIKRIEVKPGAALSLQMHHHRSEHWIVVSGMAKVTNGDYVMLVSVNESTYIPAGHKHRLENPGVLDLVMIEVQCGDYLGEDDIVRFEDVYGRV
jgi:mannose-1-phosphate guanylyltransferase/mannose-6-phosphate isomerase